MSEIRVASPEDAPGILEIYGPLVERTAISFETVVPTEEEMAARVHRTLATYPWLVAVAPDGRVSGYAYGSAFRSRPSYRWSVEVSAYVHADHRRRGLATRLYESLFEVLRSQGFFMAYAGITLPNPASVRLHERLGFRRSGVFERAGYKLGSWHDVGWWQVPLTRENRHPDEPVPFARVRREGTTDGQRPP